MRKKIEKKCEQCNKIYIGDKLRKYCTYVCAKKSRELKKTLHCESCQKEFEVQQYRKARFCSKECKIKNMESLTIEIKCFNCEKKFERKEPRIKRSNHCFCSNKCANEYNTGANHYEWKEHLHDKHFQNEIKKWGKKVKKRDNYICQECGESNKRLLQSHHIKSKSQYPNLIFDLNNGITLCVECHAQKHKDDKKIFNLIKHFTHNYYDNLNHNKVFQITS